MFLLSVELSSFAKVLPPRAQTETLVPCLGQILIKYSWIVASGFGGKAGRAFHLLNKWFASSGVQLHLIWTHILHSCIKSLSSLSTTHVQSIHSEAAAAAFSLWLCSREIFQFSFSLCPSATTGWTGDSIECPTGRVCVFEARILLARPSERPIWS